MNESILNANVFFLVTTIVVAILGILMAIAIAYFIKLLRDIDEFQKKLSTGTGELLEDIKGVKNEVKSFARKGGMLYMIRFLVRLIGRTRRRIKRD